MSKDLDSGRQKESKVENSGPYCRQTRMSGLGSVNIKMFYSGKFVGNRDYLGKDYLLIHNYDISKFGEGFIDELAVLDFDYNRVVKYAFRKPHELEFVFVNDIGVDNYEATIMECINKEKNLLEVFVECSNEVEEENGVRETEMEEPSEGRDNNEETTMDIDDDCEFDFDNLMSDSEDGDGLSDNDFSEEDEEFFEVRAKLREEREARRQAVRDEAKKRIECKSKMKEDRQGRRQLDREVDSDNCSLENLEDDQAPPSNLGRKLYSSSCAPKDIELELGLSFKDTDECQQVVRDWAIGNGYNITWTKSSAGKLQAVCRDGCEWKLYASKLNGEPTCVIKTLMTPHKCSFARKNRQANANWLANHFLAKIKKNPNYSANEMVEDIYLSHELVVNHAMCYRAKALALERIRGTFFEHYAKIWSYVAELRRNDKDGSFKVKTHLNDEGIPVFERIYIGFSALRNGFVIGCRPCIGFDACFLKTILGGALLAAVAKDCNNKMYPIAWAVVEKETEETWSWFFKQLFEDLKVKDGLGWTFMSDKQKGLINGIAALAPFGEHRNCARHIFANWKRRFSGQKLKQLFKNCVYATTASQYTLALNNLKAESTDAYHDFVSKGPPTFCKSLFNTWTKSDTVNNNICETFNAYILKARDKPLIDMLEDIRTDLMTRIHTLGVEIEKSVDVLCPNIRKKLNKIGNSVRFCQVKPANDFKYEVHTFDDSYVVDLKKWECSCREWELTGILCCHALSCIFRSREDPVDYVDRFYYKSNLIECYKHGIPPILGCKDWPVVDQAPILPPRYSKPTGRPRKVRKRGADEPYKKGSTKLSQKGMRMTCGNCGSFDHNRRTCKEPTKENRQRPPSVKQTKASNAKSSSSTSGPKTSTSMSGARTSSASGVRPARKGYGAYTSTETGNIYLRPPTSNRVNYVSGSRAGAASRPNKKRTRVEEGSSQVSQVIDK